MAETRSEILSPHTEANVEQAKARVAAEVANTIEKLDALTENTSILGFKIH